MEHWRNDKDRRTLKYFENNCLSEFFFSVTNPAWTDLGFNQSLGDERPASNRLSNDKAYIQCDNVRRRAVLRQIRVALSRWWAEKTRIQNFRNEHRELILLNHLMK